MGDDLTRPLSRAAVALVAAALAAFPSAAGASRWSRPFALSPPEVTDIGSPQVAFSPAGEAAVAFTVSDEDNPAVSRAFVALRSPSGALTAPRQVRAAQQVLALAFDGAALHLLTGTSPPGFPCCSSVALDGRRLVSGLAAAATGALVPVAPGRVLDAVATDRGVWLGRRRVAATADALAASAPGLVAWSAGASIHTSSGRAIALPPGHQVDELALMQRRRGVTAAWVESAPSGYTDVVVRDVAAGSAPRVFAVPGTYASGLAAAGDAAGNQVVAWRACRAEEPCRLWATSRRAGGRFGAPVALGPVDPYEDPVAAVSSSGESLLGWIFHGRVLAASRLGRPRVVAARADASQLTLAFGPGRRALAAWTAGSAAQQVLGAVFGG